ncbi:MAG: hypothetical protein AAGI38_09960 [Bacteroidota bacterium]
MQQNTTFSFSISSTLSQLSAQQCYMIGLPGRRQLAVADCMRFIFYHEGYFYDALYNYRYIRVEEARCYRPDQFVHLLDSEQVSGRYFAPFRAMPQTLPDQVLSFMHPERLVA